MATSRALSDLAVFAHETFEGKHSGKYVSNLPIGYGKTIGFLLPFVVDAMRRNSTKGIIVACERKEQVIQYAQYVNKAVRKDVAFPLVGHDPISCPLAKQGERYNHRKCSPHHKRYADRAAEFPILFLTHSMLALKGDGPFITWNKGKRVMVIIDEKPSAWMRPGCIDEKSLSLLRKYLDRLPRQGKAISSAIDEVEKALQRLPPRSEFQLSTTITPQHIVPLLLTIEETSKNKTLRETLESLASLREEKGMVVREGEKNCIILACRKPLPKMPTIILDATREIDPSYYLSSGIEPIRLDAWEGILPHQKHVQLETWDCNLTKYTPEDDQRWTRLIDDIQRLLAEIRMGKVYVIGAQKHKADIAEELKKRLTPEQFKRLMFAHYGNTKGSNLYRDAVAIVFTTTQFKPEWYYRAIALARGTGDITSPTFIDNGNKRFTCEELERIRIHDTVTVLVQEIGRTMIREPEDSTLKVILPWSDPQGIEMLRDELSKQFRAKITIPPQLKRKSIKKIKCELLAKLKVYMTPGQTIDRAKLAFDLAYNTINTFTKALHRNEDLLVSNGFTYDTEYVYRYPAIAPSHIPMKVAA